VRDFGDLTARGQLARLRRLGRQALERYPGGLERAPLSVLRYEQNATFRVDAARERFVLRISRPEPHFEASVASEMAWLAALRRDTRLLVPEPVVATDGSLAVAVSDPGVPGSRVCAVLRWIGGRFVEDGLTPTHLRRLGGLVAALQDHATGWIPPAGFIRPRADTLTAATKAASFRDVASAAPGDPWPTDEDGSRVAGLVRELVSVAHAGIIERALARVRATTAALGATPGSFGLIHADLHAENVLYADGEAGAIDFDDCGWGFHLYDLTVEISELTAHPRYRELRAAAVEGYAARRPVPAAADEHIDAFIVLRGLQIIAWVLESREHAAFRDDWRPWVTKELRWLASLVDGVAGG